MSEGTEEVFVGEQVEGVGMGDGNNKVRPIDH